MLEFVVAGMLASVVGYIILHTESHRDYFSPEHLFEGYPEGTFFIRPKYGGIILAITLFHVFVFWWTVANYQPLERVASFYLYTFAPLASLYYLEIIFPRKTIYTDLVGVGDERDFEKQVGVGLLIGGSVVLTFLLVPEIRMEFLELPPMAMYFITVAVPFTEEAVFGNFLTTSLLKNCGIVPAVVISGLVFAVFHYAVYQANVFYMFMAFVFRVLASLALVKFGSFIPGLVGHMFVNTIALLT